VITPSARGILRHGRIVGGWVDKLVSIVGLRNALDLAYQAGTGLPANAKPQSRTAASRPRTRQLGNLRMLVATPTYDNSSMAGSGETALTNYVGRAKRRRALREDTSHDKR
jgi:hypothetical protein